MCAIASSGWRDFTASTASNESVDTIAALWRPWPYTRGQVRLIRRRSSIAAAVKARDIATAHRKAGKPTSG